jgi:hypothetical protein
LDSSRNAYKDTVFLPLVQVDFGVLVFMSWFSLFLFKEDLQRMNRKEGGMRRGQIDKQRLLNCPAIAGLFEAMLCLMKSAGALPTSCVCPRGW